MAFLIMYVTPHLPLSPQILINQQLPYCIYGPRPASQHRAVETVRRNCQNHGPSRDIGHKRSVQSHGIRQHRPPSVAKADKPF
jgi:hypothetical protein